ncbi:small VCP/p97-interacting protein isoform X2 [Esox lucius]|uniref:small VCP/p97-interacting protein isoform X2 n=1 Tax=Esox lucius TaxID=8010 RepID=UPI0014771007|nr:small VCP/p97-interacting protein isoform X2 [Esox lucius]
MFSRNPTKVGVLGLASRQTLKTDTKKLIALLKYSTMGMCLPCFGGTAEDVVPTPDPETRRRQLAEAAEKRQKEWQVG